jgi:hypothetical protein
LAPTTFAKGAGTKCTGNAILGSTNCTDSESVIGSSDEDMPNLNDAASNDTRYKFIRQYRSDWGSHKGNKQTIRRLFIEMFLKSQKAFEAHNKLTLPGTIAKG